MTFKLKGQFKASLRLAKNYLNSIDAEEEIRDLSEEEAEVLLKDLVEVQQLASKLLYKMVEEIDAKFGDSA